MVRFHKICRMKNLLGIFLFPLRTFETIDKTPSFILPILVCSIFKVLYAFTFYSPTIEPLKIIVLYLMELVTLVIPILLCSAVFFVVFLAIGKVSAFIKFLSVFSYTFFAYRSIIIVLSIFAFFVSPNKTELNPQDILVSNLGILVSLKEHLVLHFILSSIDIIVFYHLFLISLGLSVVTPKTSIKQSLIITIIIWIVYLLPQLAIKFMVA